MACTPGNNFVIAGKTLDLSFFDNFGANFKRLCPMFTHRRQNWSHMAVHVGQVLLYSRQPIRNVWRQDVPNYRITLGFLGLQCWLVQQHSNHLLQDIWLVKSVGFHVIVSSFLFKVDGSIIRNTNWAEFDSTKCKLCAVACFAWLQKSKQKCIMFSS